jgi:hypothetical protein
MLLFARPDDLVLISEGTPLGVDNAQKYWFSVSLFAFTVAWIIIAIAVIFREYINFSLGILFEEE